MIKLLRGVGLIVILFSPIVAVKAQTAIDPKVIINKLDPTCATPGFACYTGDPAAAYDGTSTDPLVESFLSPMPFAYEPADHSAMLFNLYFAFTDVPPGTEFTCESNIWSVCAVVSSPTVGNVEWHLSGGHLSFDEGASVTLEPLISQTPEPTSALLFVTGLIAIFVAAKRRSEVRPSFV